MDIQKKIDRLDDDHIAFRKKVSEYEWDYQDMRREAKNVSEQMSEWIVSFCCNSPDTVPSYEFFHFHKPHGQVLHLSFCLHLFCNEIF